VYVAARLGWHGIRFERGVKKESASILGDDNWPLES
jgi:hypothetical protein